MILFAAALIPLGSFLSMNLNIDMLPSDIYLGQALIAFASVFFMGPIIVNDIVLGFARGTNYVITFAVIFTFSQGVFGLLGSALIGYFVRWQSTQNAQDLINHNLTNPPLIPTPSIRSSHTQACWLMRICFLPSV